MIIRALTIILLLMFAGCGRDYMTLAKVNGDTISVGDFRERLREIQFESNLVPVEEVLSLKKTILNELIEEKIIQQQGRRAGIRVNADEVRDAIPADHLDETLAKQNIKKEYWLERMKQKVLAEKLFISITQNTPQPTEIEINGTYEKNIELFHQAAQVHIQQIVMQDPKQIDEVQKKLSQGEDFSEVAKKFSTSMDASTGGDLGFVSVGLLPENIEKKVFSLKDGSVSPVLESAPDFYLIKVLEKKEAKQLSLEEARQQIKTMLLQQAKEKSYSQWLQEKTIQAKIKRNYELLQENINA